MSETQIIEPIKRCTAPAVGLFGCAQNPAPEGGAPRADRRMSGDRRTDSAAQIIPPHKGARPL